MSKPKITFTDWEGFSPGQNVGHVDGAGWSCEALVDGKFAGILKQSDMSFEFWQGDYPNEKHHGLRSRKRHTAEVEVIKILTAITTTS